MPPIKIPHHDVIVNPVLPETVFERMLKPFNAKHAALGGAPGSALAPKALPETTGSGQRVRYQNGAIYQRADGSCSWVYGAIGQRYEQLGAGASWLGLPLTDEVPMSEDGRANLFERGAIYWWPDVGAIEINEVIVHYTGLYCFGETDDDGVLSDSDEPYVLLGAVAPSAYLNTRSRVYEEDDGVDAEESRPDVLELYRGKPEGILLSVNLMEHDEGDPDKYKSEVGLAVDGASEALGMGIAAIPIVGPFLAKPASLLLKALGPELKTALNDLLGTGDDELGRTVVRLTAKQMVVLAARSPTSVFEGIGYKVESELLASHGASYKVYFGLVTA